MAICEMSVISLLGLKTEQNEILDVLSATQAAQIKKCEDYELAPAGEDRPTVGVTDDRARKSLAFLESSYEELGDKKLAPVVKDGFGVSLGEFISYGNKRDEIEKVVDGILSLAEEYSRLKAEAGKLGESVVGYAEYACLKEKFSFYTPTKTTVTLLGTVASDKCNAFMDALSSEYGVVAEILGSAGSKQIAAVTCLKESYDAAAAIATRYAFAKCPYTEDATAREIIDGLNAEIGNKNARLREILLAAAAFNARSAEIKTYVDYIGFLTEKSQAKADCGQTGETFLLEAYVPTEAVERVEKAINEKATACYIESRTVPRDEYAPTLMKNNKIVSDFEVVTNMYSAPAYGALDPNGVMAFFFSLFMGVIMGDAGYGLLMILGGFLLSAKSRKGTSIYRMARVFAYGGFFAVAFGTLFDSFLGFALLRNIPSYAEFYAKYVDPIAAKCTLAGITVPSALMWCLGLGTFQIAVSLVMKAVQCFRRGEVLEGVCSGLIWSFALISFVLFVFFAIKGDKSVSGVLVYPTIALFAAGILTSGITEKGFGKVTKIFGSAYGLINYASDVLSYARLYGLMLAGAQIASIFTNSIAVGMLFPKGVIGIIAGVLVIIAGNLFNLAMNLLGAFIHDSRLQYVEFFGRFYEGEGELFAPLGSQREFIYFK